MSGGGAALASRHPGAFLNNLLLLQHGTRAGVAQAKPIGAQRRLDWPPLFHLLL